jgi:hypothetical protein
MGFLTAKRNERECHCISAWHTVWLRFNVQRLADGNSSGKCKNSLFDHKSSLTIWARRPDGTTEKITFRVLKRN